MISLELTNAPVDQTKLFLCKGRRVAVCHACQKSYSRLNLFRCQDCKHEFCQGCIDVCRCKERVFRVKFNFWKRKPEPVPVRNLALVR